ncbi:prenyltransferase [Pseudonocardia sp. K10HN5]|uniref:Prenyltransferase n=1 Tax=Pseudonocardia acidicola TaxID=2724939 RepID=A0ABX1SEQ3_9PSEU|nr:prenyltransferase [Pseudonocardia acidicola]
MTDFRIWSSVTLGGRRCRVNGPGTGNARRAPDRPYDPGVTEATPGSRLRSWAYALRTTNPPPDAARSGRIDAVTRWIVVSRAAVLPMTLVSGLVAALLAVGRPGLDWPWLVLAIVGITLAHIANNLMNDLYDTRAGSDSASYPRALYAPHPVLAGLVSRRTLLVAIVVVNAADLALLVVLAFARGWPVVAFAVAGLGLSVAYTAPPLRLKKRGLGEPDVLVVWGPLMVGGTYYAAVGSLPWQVLVASLPYGLLCTTVLMGKHIDKTRYDAPLGIRTLPVMLGEQRARAVTLGLMAGFYPLVGLAVLLAAMPWPALVVVAAVPRLVTVWPYFRRPPPREPPKDFPVWPLWYAALAWVHVRQAGALLVLGLATGAVLRVGGF